MKTIFTIIFLVVSLSGINVESYNSNIEIDNDMDYDYMTEEEFEKDFITIDHLDSKAMNFTLEKYFQNLFDYSPINSHGSCGYVSFIQYLSYIDTFINDDFIQTKYEQNQGVVSNFNTAISVSPGVLRNSYPESDLFKHIKSTKSYDFQMYLMDIVNSYYDRTVSEYSPSIGMWDYDIILDSILPNYNVEFTYKSYKDFGTLSKPTDTNIVNWFDDYVKKQLDLGFPVMLHIADYNDEKNELENYHSIVAYYYDDDGIHAHFGWGESSSDTIISSKYQITEAGKISLDSLNEKHSNNYLIGNSEYCGCGYVTHTHNYSDHYCSSCNKYTETHDYHAPYTWLNYTEHTASCGCGDTTNQGHAISSSSFNSGSKYGTCLLCGGKATIGFIQYNTSVSNFNYITKNGSFILPNGVIVLVEEDIADFISNPDIFYN